MDFSVISNLSYNKKYKKLDEQEIGNYQPFLVNRAFSQFPDSVLQANFLNMNWFLPIQTQYDYLFYSLRKRKRFSKWPKKQQSDAIPFIIEYYKCSPREAKEYDKILSSEEKEELKRIYGGTK